MIGNSSIAPRDRVRKNDSKMGSSIKEWMKNSTLLPEDVIKYKQQSNAIISNAAYPLAY
ncbi:hypothetical protein D3C73_1605780 [compost metagenome]